MLTRAAILAAIDLATQEVAVPEWGGSVHVRTMTGTDRNNYEQLLGEKKADAITGLLALTLCDESGSLLFTLGDLEALAAKSSKVLVRIFDAALKLNKLRAGDVDAAEKN